VWRADTYNIVFILKVGIVFLHGLEDGLEGRDEVVENGSPPCFALHALEAASIDDSHLLEHCGFAAFTGTCALVSVKLHSWFADGELHTEQQQLYFALCPLLVGAERLFDLGIFLARLWVYSGWFSSEAHDCWCHVMWTEEGGVWVGGRDGAESSRDKTTDRQTSSGGLANKRLLY
jgi:hypothetical protein